MNTYSHLKSRGMNDVKFLIGNEKFAKEIQRINPVNNDESNKSKEPATSANGVWLVDKKCEKGWTIVNIAITTHYLGEWWLLKKVKNKLFCRGLSASTRETITEIILLTISGITVTVIGSLYFTLNNEKWEYEHEIWFEEA